MFEKQFLSLWIALDSKVLRADLTGTCMRSLHEDQGMTIVACHRCGRSTVAHAPTKRPKFRLRTVTRLQQTELSGSLSEQIGVTNLYTNWPLTARRFHGCSPFVCVSRVQFVLAYRSPTDRFSLFPFSPAANTPRSPQPSNFAGTNRTSIASTRSTRNCTTSSIETQTNSLYWNRNCDKPRKEPTHGT